MSSSAAAPSSEQASSRRGRLLSLPTIIGRLGWIPWSCVVFLVSAAMIALGVLTQLPLPLPEALRGAGFFDLRVYRQAAGIVARWRPAVRHDAVFSRAISGSPIRPPQRCCSSLLRAGLLARRPGASSRRFNLGLVVVVRPRRVALRRPVAVRPRALGCARGRARPGLLAAAAVWIEPVSDSDRLRADRPAHRGAGHRRSRLGTVAFGVGRNLLSASRQGSSSRR